MNQAMSLLNFLKLVSALREKCVLFYRQIVGKRGKTATTASTSPDACTATTASTTTSTQECTGSNSPLRQENEGKEGRHQEAEPDANINPTNSQFQRENTTSSKAHTNFERRHTDDWVVFLSCSLAHFSQFYFNIHSFYRTFVNPVYFTAAADVLDVKKAEKQLRAAAGSFAGLGLGSGRGSPSSSSSAALPLPMRFSKEMVFIFFTDLFMALLNLYALKCRVMPTVTLTI